MSRTSITLKFKMCPHLDEACSYTEKLLTDTNLPSLMPDEDNNFGGSLVSIFEIDDVTCNPRILRFVFNDLITRMKNYYKKLISLV